MSHRIHEHPELGYEEVFAHDLLTGVIADEGLDGRAPRLRPRHRLRGPGRVRAGRPSPCAASTTPCPGIGHACGHNIIAAAGLGAGLAAAALADEAGGRVVILGTPAEEGGGGKVRLIDAGAFEGVDAALMVHPAGGDLRSMNVIAIHQRAGHLPRPGGPRRRLPLEGPQRPRRRRARLRERGRPAPAHPARRAHPRHLHRGGRQAQHRPGPGRGRVVRAGRRRCAAWSSSRSGCWPACRPGPMAAGCTHGATTGRSPSTPTCATTCPWSTSTPANAAAARPRRWPAPTTPSRWWAAPTWATSATWCPASTR